MMAGSEDDFFYPVNSEFAWTSTDEGEEANAKGIANSNVDRLLSQQHGVQYDPANKVN